MTTSDGSITDTNIQPAPKPNDRPAVWDMVVQDMRYRDRFGFEKYGTRLQPLNGRDFLVDAYQEALDLVVYLRGAIYERDNTVADHARPAIPADFGQQNQLDTGAMRFETVRDWVKWAWNDSFVPDNPREEAIGAVKRSNGRLIICELGFQTGPFKDGGFTGKGCLNASPVGGPILRCPDCIAEHCACIAS